MNESGSGKIIAIIVGIIIVLIGLAMSYSGGYGIGRG